MAAANGPDGINNGLICNFDPGNNKSYSGSGTTLGNMGGPSNLTLSNGPVYSSEKLGSLVLDGLDDYAYITNSVTNSTLSPSVATFSIWVKPNSSGIIDNRGSSLISRGNYNTSGGFFIIMASNSASTGGLPTVYAQFSYSTTTSYNFNGTNAYSLSGWNTWSNVVVAVDSTISLYVDGSLKETTAARSNSVSTIIYGNGTINTNGDTDLVLCSSLSYAATYNGGSWQPYKGSFSNFQMWNRRLSASEILRNFNSQKSRFGI